MAATMPIFDAHGKSAGFTYLWVLMTVAFAGIGLSLAAQVHTTAIHRDQEAALLAIGRQFQQALRSYANAAAVDGPSRYPQNLGDLLEDRRGPVVRRHLRQVFVDPVTGQAQWGEVRVGGRLVGLHSLSDAAAIKRDHFDPDMQHLTGKDHLKEWVFGLQP